MALPTDPIIVFHIPETRSERVVWLLEEVGAPFEVRRLSYRDRDVKKPPFLALNPFGMVPTISVGSIGIRETGAIFDYLLSRHARALAVTPEEPGYLQYLEWLHSTEPTLFPPVADHLMHEEVLPEPERIAEVARRGREKWSEHLRIIDAALAANRFIAADRFTAADILVGHLLRMAKLGGLVPSEMKHACAYLDRLQARPAYQRMLAA